MQAPLARRRPFFAWWRASLACCWGLMVSLPHIHTFGNSLAWTMFTDIAPEELWGLLMLAAGVLHLGALAKRWTTLRAICALYEGSLWLAFAVGFLTTMPTGLTWITYGFLSIASFHDWLVLVRVAPAWWPWAFL